MQLCVVIKMPLADDSTEKWIYSEHTKVKHTILGKYLVGWSQILGKFYNLNIFDCFAGRGEYSDDKGGTVEGSPLIILKKLVEVRERLKRPEKANCIFVEKNNSNFENLRQLVAKEIENYPEKYRDWLEIDFHNNEFANVADEILNKYDKKLVPSFFFVDPFGFSGVPFEIIRNILSIEKTEVFINFNVRDVNRFLESSQHRHSIEDLYGIGNVTGELTRSYPNLSREQALLKLYRDRLHYDAGAEYNFPFKVCADNRHQTMYYLIHSTNHPLGCKLMKEIMYKAGTEGRFGYYGPAEGQMSLTYYQGIPKLKDFLLDRFAGETLSFKDLLYRHETLMETYFVEKDFRKAIKELNGEGKVSIQDMGSRGGLREKSLITFRTQ